MAQSSNKRIITLAILLSLATAGMIFMYLNKIRTQAIVGEGLPVMVAAKDIPAKTPITEDMLKQTFIPKAYIHPQAITASKDLIGSITSAPILQGEQFINGRVVKSDDKSAYLAYNVPTGKRAVSINVTEVIGVGFMIQPGDSVDVIATIQPDQPTKLATRTVIQDVQVLAVAQDRGNVTEDKTKLSKTYTLSVTPDQAEALMLSEDKGHIRLTLRNPADHNWAPTLGLNLDTLMARNR